MNLGDVNELLPQAADDFDEQRLAVPLPAERLRDKQVDHSDRASLPDRDVLVESDHCNAGDWLSLSFPEQPEADQVDAGEVPAAEVGVPPPGGVIRTVHDGELRLSADGG